jgi:ABC-type transport system involved in cytochrome c biogenesis permease component
LENLNAEVLFSFFALNVFAVAATKCGFNLASSSRGSNDFLTILSLPLYYPMCVTHISAAAVADDDEKYIAYLIIHIKIAQFLSSFSGSYFVSVIRE